MRTIFTITNRNFVTLEFAQKFANKNNLDYSLIEEKQIKDFQAHKNVFVKENQFTYFERRAKKAI